MHAVNRFSLLSLAWLLVGTVLSPITARGDVASPDWRQDLSEKVWAEQIRPGFFQDRAISESEVGNVIELKAPYRAEDATVVPISIHTRIPQSAEKYIKTLHVFIDKNPVPLVGIFEFTPESGRADLALRVRVDDFSFVRAIAETNTGELFLAKSFVRATGACSAPPPKSIDDSIANMGEMRMKTIGQLELNEPNLVQLMIKHPNITGMQPMKIGSRVLPPAHFVRHLAVSYDGHEIMQAQLTFSVSMDPSFRFFFVPREEGVMTVEAVDTQDNHWTATKSVSRS